MIDARFRNALRDLVDELENAIARCRAEVESVASGPNDEIEELSDLVDDIFEDSEKAPKAGFLIVSVEALEALRAAISDVSGGEVESAFDNLVWEARKALRDFKETLTHSGVNSEVGASQ